MRYNIQFDFVKHRKKFYMFSIIVTLLGVLSLGLFGLNFGVDFRAGSTLDIDTGKPVTAEQARDLFAKAGFEGINPSVGGDRVSVRFEAPLTQQQVQAIDQAFKAEFGDQVSYEENTVDPALAREQLTNAGIAVLVASLFIIIYISIRFEWRFAVSGVIALLHDALIVISLFSIFRLEVNLPFIVAVLTIIGYSINDTIVIFDRIRENMRFGKTKTAEDLAFLVDNSIWQTLTRSINTVMTVLVAAVALFIFGSESIRLFSLAMILGLVSGAYSSICVASQLWYDLKKRSPRRSK
ncbi:protein translocase subunit SecF [Paenibacillus thermotolerans]|uniref:protein translocase subunit SecF n=1 Tax=Paenibacillus thermotolerans TaxID=3027807 RepID=UPI002367F615|nr:MULTISPECIES: protein translocase subunit SecF [unclassified Paenibacillus]